MWCHLVVTLLQFCDQKVVFEFLFTKIVTYEHFLIMCFVENCCHQIITNNDFCFNKKIRPLLQNDNTYLRFVVQLSCLLKVSSKYFIYLDMQFTVFQYTVQNKNAQKKLALTLVSDFDILNSISCCQINLFYQFYGLCVY